MSAGAATSVKPAASNSGQQPTKGQTAGDSAAAPDLPRWDLNDGDTWYKRQQVMLFLDFGYPLYGLIVCWPPVGPKSITLIEWLID